MNTATKYNLEKYLKDRKKEDADKPARQPSGFMKRHLEKKAQEERNKADRA